MAATLADIEKTLGKVPSYFSELPDAALPSTWQQVKDLDISGDTALPAKTKALISLAVGAQIPCDYCIWIDTEKAKAAGATEEEIKEAIAIAGYTRYWSTLLHGMQVDFSDFKAEVRSLSE
ncbi:carboxymuconolactone decarboxylase family protein [Bauldia sp.]|uniref:carboxymuconolactone decarboxylase family protein n=1 Tax=Bauldia sp. TaxID=2575872 RepID=UPI003BA93793